MAYKGKYKPKYRSKYKGDPTKIIYRSLWERRFMVYCDENPNIIKWASEEVIIPYRTANTPDPIIRYIISMIISSTL